MANTDLVNEGLLGAYHDELMKTHLAGGVVFDISAYNLTNGQPTPYADLAAALGTNGANVPEPLRKGGMSVKYVCTSDNNYLQYRYLPDDAATNSKFTNVANWQGVDDKPTAGSNNLVESGGVKKALDEIVGDFVVNVAAEEGVKIEKIIYPYALRSGASLRIKITASSSSVVPTAGTISLRGSDDAVLKTGKYWSVGDDYTLTLDRDIDYIKCVVAQHKVGASGTLTFETITEGIIQDVKKSIAQVSGRVTTLEGNVTTLNNKDIFLDNEIVKTNSNIGYYKGYDTVVQNTAKQYKIGYILNAGERFSIRITGNSSLVAIAKPFVVKANSPDGTTLALIGMNEWNDIILESAITRIYILISAVNSANSGDIVIEVSSQTIFSAYKEMNENTNTDFKNFCKKIGTTPIATWVDDDGTVTGTQNIQNIVLPVSDALGVPVTFAVIDLNGSAVYDGNTYTKEEFFELMQRKGHHITSHPAHEHWYGENYDITQVEPELIDNLMLLKNKFLHSDMLIYPGSSSNNPLVVDIVKKWCVCGVTAGLNKPNHLGDNTKWQIKRTFISLASIYDTYHNTPGFVNARKWLTDVIDEAYANGDWIVFGTHSWLFSESDSRSDANANTRGNLRYIINYAKEKGFEFKTLWDAYNTRRILFDVNDYNQNM